MPYRKKGSGEGYPEVACPQCGGLFESRGLPGHVKWAHEFKGLLLKKHEDEKKKAVLGPGLEAVEEASPRVVDLAPPKVFRVKKMRPPVRKEAELVAETVAVAEPVPKRKGLFDWNNFYDRESAEFAAEVAAGNEFYDKAIPDKKGSVSPWAVLGLFLAGGLGFAFLRRNKKAAAAAPAAAAGSSGSGGGGVGGGGGLGSLPGAIAGGGVGAALLPTVPVVPSAPAAPPVVRFVPPTALELALVRLNEPDLADHRDE